MLRPIAHLFLFAAILFLINIPVFGWDETGHKITAYIAWQQMTPEVREKVIKILTSAPEDAQLSTFYMPYGSRRDEARKREFFMFVASWADVIRDRNFDTRYKKYNNGNWHYFDTLWTIKDGKVEYMKGPDSGKLMEKLVEFDKLIRGSASDAEKAIAIAWLEHLIGDLHQPLHTTGRVYDDSDRKGDQGGNLFLLIPKGSQREPGKPNNLHAYWDGIIGVNMPNTSDACDADYLYPIAQTIMKAYPYSSLQGRLADGKFDVWEKEGVELSTTEVYKGVSRYETPSEDYKKKALKIGEKQLALAGYRMGNLFNAAFAPPPLAAATPPPAN